MTTWNYRLLPHPLLAPWTDDYGDATFVGTVPHAVLNNGKDINLTIKYHLTSQALRELIAKEAAQYVGLVSSPKTFNRNAYTTNQEDDIQILDASDYAQALRFIPYVVATRRIEGFISEEHNEEIRYIKPNGFSIPPGSILAVGDSTAITLEEGGSPYSVIDLVSHDSVPSGLVELSFDDNRIKINLAPEDKKRVEALRGHGELSTNMAVLFPAIYLHAVTEALRNLAAEDYSDKQWTRTMRQALERHNITVDDEEVRNHALQYAQMLMEKPVGTLLTALGNED